MSKLKLSAEKQTQRLNQIIKRVQELQELDIQTLCVKPDSKSWSVIEVLGHMNAAYLLYENRIDECLANLPENEDQPDSFLAGRKNSFVINLIAPPQENKRSMKMKTMKRFEPEFSSNQLESKALDNVFKQFFSYQSHLKNAIKQSRSKDLKQARIISAIGPVVKFYLPEAFEFLISHEERHLVQINNVLELVLPKNQTVKV